MTTPNLKDPRFTGCFTAIITPFAEDGATLHVRNLHAQIDAQAAGGVRGIVIAGTTGESPTLSEREYEQLAAAAIERARAKGLLAVLGTGSNSTSHAVHLQKAAARLGADATLSVNPYYNKPTQEGLYRHFSTQADATDLPVILYNIPGRSGVALAPATVQRLGASARVVAVKEATGSTDSASEIAIRCPSLALLSGDDSMTLPFASVGGVGVVSVVSNILPGEVSGLCAAILEGRWREALTMHRGIFDFCRAMFLETNPIPVKAAMKMLGRDTGAMRLPMCEAGEATIRALREALRAQELI